MSVAPAGRPLAALAGWAAVFLGYALATWVLHREVLPQRWAFDDAYILGCAVTEPWHAFLWSPDSYRRLSIAFFTPLLPISYATDLALYGLEPRWFYAEQLGWSALAATLVCAVVRRWHAISGVAAGLVFLLTGPVTLACATLMFRHYLIGACWALVATLLLLGARGPGWRAWAAGGAYLVAMLFKEVYVPLGVVLPFLLIAGGGRRRRGIATCAPLWGALLLYVPWRLAMIGRLGGYSDTDASSWLDLGDALARLDAFARIVWCQAEAGGLAGAGAVALSAAAVAALVWCRRRDPRALLASALVAAAAFATVVPVWSDLRPANLHDYRLAIHLAVLVAIAAGYLLARLAVLLRRVGPAFRRGAAAGLAVALAACGAIVVDGKSAILAVRIESMRTHSREYDFVLSGDSDATLVTSAPIHHWDGLAAVRRALRGEPSPAVCSVPFDLREAGAARYVQYSASTGGFVDITGPFRAARRELAARRVDAPMAVTLAIEDHRLAIRVDDGEARGAYHLLRGGVADVYEAYPIPGAEFRMASFWVPREPYFVRIARIADDGAAVSISPEWRIDLDRDRAIHWRR